MITFEEAQALMREQVKPGRIRRQPLLESLGLALARPVRARADSPRFDVSAVDGYAVSLSDFSSDLPVTLPILDVVHAGASVGAGRAPRKHLKPGSTHRILTGAAVPKGTDAIVMQEEITASGEMVTFQSAPRLGVSIRKQGGEFRRGERLFAQGTVITPSVAQSLAACGYAQVPVYARPTVSIITTGDELRTPGSRLHYGEIWDSNRIALEAAMRALGITNIRIQHVRDNPASTARATSAALERSDIVITTGGVSVGDRDYVKEALHQSGAREIFWRVRIKPGKPLYFAIKRQKAKVKYIFGLPGNPVAAMVTYQLFVRPAMLRMMGHVERDASESGVLTVPLKKSDPRTEFVRARREWASDARSGIPMIVPLDARGSHMTTGMALADCLLVFPADQEFLAAGSNVEIIPLRWAAY